MCRMESLWGREPGPSALQPCHGAGRRDLTGLTGSREEHPEGARWFRELLAQTSHRLQGLGYLCDLGRSCSRGRRRFSLTVPRVKAAVRCDVVAVPPATVARAVAVLERAAALPVPGRGCPSKAACWSSGCCGQDGRGWDAMIKRAQKGFERQHHAWGCMFATAIPCCSPTPCH